MSGDKLIIAGAGSGKTFHLVERALSDTDRKTLITTYTEENESKIREMIIKKKGCIPSNITVKPWFSTLLEHGVRPYQGSFNRTLFDQIITGMLLVNKQSGLKYQGGRHPVYHKEDVDFIPHYFTKSMQIYSDKISKFAYKANKATGGELIARLSRIFPSIFIDEVQDLAGYDLSLLDLLFRSESTTLLVGDPRQVTYLTHHEKKYGKYRNGGIKNFILTEVPKRYRPEIDEETLTVSHRNHEKICSYSSRLFPKEPVTHPCSCCSRDDDHAGVYIVAPSDVDEYLSAFQPVQLRWDTRKKVNHGYMTKNLGESKGLTFDRVLIYPTAPMVKWVGDNSSGLSDGARAKLYVGLTRARYSAAIVMDFNPATYYAGIECYSRR